MRKTIEGEINKAACDELGSLGTTLLSSMISSLESLLENYLLPLPPKYADPLNAEKELPPDIDLVDLSSMEGEVGNWFSMILKQLETYLRSDLVDPTTDNDTGMDLGINKLLRSTILDEDGALVASDTSIVIFDGHDMLTETTMTLTELKIFGLDSFSQFDPLLSPGNYTLSNHFFWKHIDIELRILLEIKPSSLDDSLIDIPSDPEVIENIVVRVGVNDVDVDLFFLLAVKEDDLGDIELGQMFDTGDILPCITNAIQTVELTGLSAAVSNIDPPSLEGFISNGIDSVVTNSAKAAFEMYESSIIKALPNAFETTLRDFVNNLLSETTRNDNNDCPSYDSQVDEVVDFRDFFLKPDEAKQFGGTGDKRYGDVGSLILSVLEDEFFAPSQGGSDYIILNDVIVKPLTKSQSGKEGELKMKSDLLSISSDFVKGSFASVLGESMDIRAYNAKIRNIDTFHAPVQFLSPRTPTPFLLNNSINIGSVVDDSYRRLSGSNDLSLSGDFSLGIAGEDSPFKMENNVYITVGIPTVTLGAEIEAHINSERLMTFPLKDITNMQCLLALLEDYESVGSSYEEALEFLLVLSSIELDFECISCSSSGLNSLPDVLDNLNSDGILHYFRTGIDNIAHQYLAGEWLQETMKSLVSHAPMQCPHDPSFDDDYYNEVAPISLSLNRENTEFLVYFSAVLSQVILAIVAISHDPENMKPTNEELPSINSSVDLNEVKGILDTVAIQLGAVEDGDLVINNQIRSFLGEDAAIAVNVTAGMSSVSIVQIRIKGLDTFTFFNVLNITSSQFVTNEIELEELLFEFDLDLHLNDELGRQRITLRFGAQDVSLTLAAMTGIHFDEIGDIKLGSLLDVNNAISCLLSSMEAIHITEFVVSAKEMNRLEIDGFVYDYWSHAFNASLNALIDDYEETILSSLPNLFNVTMRTAMNNLIRDIIDNGPGMECLNIEGTDSSLINLSDLLFSEAEATLVGGTGEAPYGNIVANIVSMVEMEAFKIDQLDGTSFINELLIAPLTNFFSGTPGTLTFPEIFQQKSSIDIGALQADLELQIFDAQIQNLDTVGFPLDLFKGVSPQTFDTTATIGVGDRPLRASTQFQISFVTDGKLDLLVFIYYPHKLTVDLNT